MADIRTKVQELEDPRRFLKGNRFDFMIDFINPDDGREDETDTEIDFYDLSGQTFKDEILDFWKGFCKDQKWDPSEIEIVDVWGTVPDIDEISISEAVTNMTKTGSFYDYLEGLADTIADRTGNRLKIGVRISDGKSEENQATEKYDQKWDIFTVTILACEYGPMTFQRAAEMINDIYMGYQIGRDSK